MALMLHYLSGFVFVTIARAEFAGFFGPYWVYRSNWFHIVLLTCVPLAAHFVGGLVAGRVTSYSPGASGALSAVLTALIPSTVVFFSVLSSVVNASPDAVPFSENAGVFFVFVSLFAVYFPFTVLAGFVGGRLGGLWSATRS